MRKNDWPQIIEPPNDTSSGSELDANTFANVSVNANANANASADASVDVSASASASVRVNTSAIPIATENRLIVSRPLLNASFVPPMEERESLGEKQFRLS